MYILFGFLFQEVHFKVQCKHGVTPQYLQRIGVAAQSCRSVTSLCVRRPAGLLYVSGGRGYRVKLPLSVNSLTKTAACPQPLILVPLGSNP